MRNIFKIYKKDLKDILKNPALLIVIMGLAILPSLYAWFNIKASWDPYGSTGNISVAIVNKDKGSEALEKKVNVGKELVDNLKENKNLGWEFVDEKKAKEGVENGKYYASIEIPENFSKDITSVLDSKVKKGELIYTVNEKINAIAPKITDKGASTIQLEINETVVKTVSETIFEVFNKIGIEIENQLPKLTEVESSLIDVKNKFKDIDKTINFADDATVKVSEIVKEVQKDIPNIKNTVESAKNLSGDVKTFVQDTKDSVNNISPIIKSDLDIITNISSSIVESISNLIDVINKGEDIAPEVINSLQQKLSSLNSISNNLLEFLKKLDKITPGNNLKDAISQLESINNKVISAINTLESIKNNIASGQNPSLDNLNGILKVANDINSITSGIVNNFDAKISTPINKIFEGTINVSNNVINILEEAEKKLPKVDDILSTTLDFSASANDNVNFIKEKMPLAKNIVDELVEAMGKINNSDEMDELVDLLKNDIIAQSDFLKQPVELKTEKLYPVANYGSAMTPFYTVLSLWVGILLLVSILTTEVHGEYKNYEKYFGRALIFTTITIVQSLIVSLGDVYLLGVEVTNVSLFVGLSVFTSIVFTFIVYSLVSVFGNIGKAIAIVMLVIQVAGSGGTFPIEVTPQFFQNVNPLLPFTHAINGLREAIAGVYTPNLTNSIQALIFFLVVFMVINVSIKGFVNRYMEKFNKKFNESDLIGH
ncbi:MAG: YhgE/Pip family protein [Peptostreptococcaceae bacterium]